MTKKLFSLLFILVLLCSLCLPVQAHDVPLDRNDCSIELLLRYDGKNIEGGTLTAIRVGQVAEDDGNYSFCRVTDQAALEDVESSETATQLDAYYLESKDTFDFLTKTVPVAGGKALFRDLPTGLYLIRQEEATPGYHKLSSFLVSVPFLKDGEYVYEITINAKPELEREADPTKPKPTTPSKPSGPDLPQTGQLNWPVPVLAVCGVVLFAAGWVLRFGRKKEQHEK